MHLISSSVGMSKEEIDRLEKEEEEEEAEREKNTRRNLLEDLENRFEQVNQLVKTYFQANLFHKHKGTSGQSVICMFGKFPDQIRI